MTHHFDPELLARVRAAERMFTQAAVIEKYKECNIAMTAPLTTANLIAREDALYALWCQARPDLKPKPEAVPDALSTQSEIVVYES